MRAASGRSGAPGGVLGPGVHSVGAGEQLLGALAFGLHRGLVADGGRGVDVGLLVVEERLVFVACALGVVEHVLRRRASRLSEPGLGLAGLLFVVAAGVFCTGVDFVVELGLLLVEVALVAVPDRLLAVSQGLFEAGDALIGVKILLCSVWHGFTSPVGSGEKLLGGRWAREQIPLGVVDAQLADDRQHRFGFDSFSNRLLSHPVRECHGG